jgi:NAD(P)-dependent dehydrogenase (short-subunit alcohol dehydrogenase family)
MNDQRSVFITGVSQGIGNALASEFAKSGWKVWGTVRTNAFLEFSNLDYESRNRIVLLPLDLANLNSCESVKDAVTGPIDVLISNAATFAPRAFDVDSFDPHHFLDAFLVNVVGPATICRAVKPRLLAGKKKLVIMMSTGNASLAGNTTGTMLAYRASKSALNQLVRTIAAEWKENGITTIALNPGWVRTKMGGEAAPLDSIDAAVQIIEFVTSANERQNGLFLNTDGSELPW